MRLAEAILRALEVTGGYDPGEFVNNPDEWRFHMGDRWETRLPMLTRPVENMDRESIEAYVHGWIAHSEHYTDASIIESAGELTEQICDFILTDEYGTYEPPPAPAEEKKSGDKWTRPNRMVCLWNYGRIDLSAYAVLQTMVSHGDDNGGGIFISQRRIADIHGWSTTEPVRRAQRRLEKAGAVTKLEPGRHGKPTRWRLNTPPETPYSHRGKND